MKCIPNHCKMVSRYILLGSGAIGRMAVLLLLLPLPNIGSRSDAVLKAEDNIYFVDATEKSNLKFKHENGASGEGYLVEFMGAGVCIFDANNDGFADVYFLNGLPLPGMPLPNSNPNLQPQDHLFLNLQDGTFRESLVESRIAESGYGLGVTAADFDNDGFQDLYINNYGPNQLLRNNGDGTFSDITESVAVADGNKFGAGANFLDIDSDGDLDLFSANYVEFSFERHHKLAPSAFPYSPGPKDFPAAPDTLFLNNGDGTFSDISRSSGIAAVAGPSMGVVASDLTEDGLPDILVVCDGEPNLLYRNEGNGKFVEDALLAGLAYDLRGLPNGNMGVELGDLDGDGLQDLFVTDYAAQLPIQYRNLGLGLFSDVTRLTKAGTAVFPHVTWGIGMVDFDCDRDRDIFICVGHILENAKEIEPKTDYKVENCVMENEGNQFRDASAEAGLALKHTESSRGAAFEDLDNDGDVDCVILNCGAESQYLENQTVHENHWLEIRLVGVTGNRDGIGSEVLVSTGSVQQVQVVCSGRGYQSHYGTRLHFGLGNAQSVEQIEINWFGRRKQKLRNVEIDQILTIVETQDQE
ncbi:MAG: CRTAC1 family protein [Aureliella sp.]